MSRHDYKLTVNAEGCAAYQLDTDDDGVSDDVDQCPGLPLMIGTLSTEIRDVRLPS